MLLQRDREFLHAAFQKCYDLVKDSDFHRRFAEEKIRHSLQVFGAGNYIIKNEPSLNHRDEGFLKKARQAVLLHDVGRFAEILNLYRHPEKRQSDPLLFDHGLLGAEILEKNRFYQSPSIVLSVRHHGHLAEEFYHDPDYRAIIDSQERQETEEIWKLVRDADKIANLYLIVREYRFLHDLFFSGLSSEEKSAPISPEIWQDFMDCRIIDWKKIRSLKDRILQIIAFNFELYFPASDRFMERLQINRRLLQIFSGYEKDKKILEKVSQCLYDYIESKHQ